MAGKLRSRELKPYKLRQIVHLPLKAILLQTPVGEGMTTMVPQPMARRLGQFAFALTRVELQFSGKSTA